MWPNKDGEEEPEWLSTEREQFSSFRDKNKDGKMDRDEVKEWIVPPDYDHSEAEAKHLIQESDKDKVCNHCGILRPGKRCSWKIQCIKQVKIIWTSLKIILHN